MYKKESEGGKHLRESIRYLSLLPVSVQRCPTRDGRRCFLMREAAQSGEEERRGVER